MSVHPAIDRDSTTALLNPYPGLRPFAETEQRLFFGRTYQVGEILQRLERTSFAVVTGGSGSGKSSIVNAGVIPALRKRQLASRGDFWLAATFSPKDQPFRNLAAELARLIEPLAGQSSDQLVEDVEQGLLETNSLAGFFERYESRIILEEGQAPESRASANLLIFCDQFEEIFREQNRDNPEAAQLVDLIVEAYRNQSRYPRLFVMIGMRSEDLHRCAAFIDLPNVINGSVFLTRRLDEAEIVSAIVEPMRLSLRLRGIAPESYQPVEVDPWPFDADVLHRLNLATSAMASDPDHLPLLQHLLSVFWRFLEQKKLPAALGKAPGGPPKFSVSSEDLAHALGFASATKMDEALRDKQAKHPEEKRTESWILNEALDQAAEGVMPSDHRLEAITSRMFRLLAEVDDRGNYKRRWTSRREIIEVCADRRATPEEIDGIIAAFSSPYPFLNARPGLDGKIDVSHESFIRSWMEFTDWLKHERRLAVAYDMLRRKYLERQHALAERAKSALAKFWFRPSYGVSREELVQLKDWHDRRSENAAWANRYINGLEGEDPEADRKSADDNQAEAFNRRLLRFYNWALLFSYKKVAGWGVTALALVGFAAVMLELKLQDIRHDREFTSVSGTLASEQIRQLNAERTGVDARELYQKLPLLTASEAMVQSAGKSETLWGWMLDQYRALTFRTNEPRPFYYYARHSNDEIARKALDAAIFPIDYSKEKEGTGPTRPNDASTRAEQANEQLKEKCFEKLSKPRALGRALADTEMLLTSDPNAKLAVAPLEPEDGRKIAILPTNQGSLVLLVLSLSSNGECTVKYLQGLSLPPGKLQIDDTLRLVAVNASEAQPTWLYRIWWNRHCSLQENATTGRCEIPFTVEVTGPTLTDRQARIINQNRVEMENGGKMKQFELRSDHRLTSVTEVGADVFQGEPKPHRCVNQGRFMAFIKEEVSPGSSEDPPARTLFVIEEAESEADCKKLPNFDMAHQANVPKNLIATLSVGYFPIKDIAFSGAQADGGLPDYIYLRRGDAPLPIHRIALSPSKLHCSDKDAAKTAQRYPIYRSLLETARFTEDRVTTLREQKLRMPSCPGKWDDDKLPKADQPSR